MIYVSRVNGDVLVLNTDLVATIEGGSDTVVTLISGEKILVRESVEDIIDRVVEFRRRIWIGPGKR